MAQTARSKDLYMNIFPMQPTDLSSAADNTLYHHYFDTGLSIRGGLIWLIHAIEFELDFRLGADAETLPGNIKVACSTKKGVLVEPPYLGDEGCLMVRRYNGMGNQVTAAGLQWDYHWGNQKDSFLPPIPLASPNLSLYSYAQDISSMCLYWFEARVFYTTMPVDEATYTEIAEVWQW